MKLILYVLGCFVFLSVLLGLAARFGAAAFDRETASRAAMFTNARIGDAGGEISARPSAVARARLPAPLRRYLKQAGVAADLEKLRGLKIQQAGCIRLQPGADCRPFLAEQFFSTEPPAFLWSARLPGLSVQVRDSFTDGRGQTQVNVAGWIPLADASGPGLDQGAALRYLAELVWMPAAFLGSELRWEALSDERARAWIRYGDQQEAAADFHFNARNEIEKVTAMREREVGGRTELTAWVGEYREYRRRGPFRIPLRGRSIWRLPAGDYPAVEVELSAVDFISAQEP